MALGGGTFTTQNKVLPGAYINFISTKMASVVLSDRGMATMPLELDWGKDDEIFEVTNEDFQKNSLSIFGYDYTHEKLKGLRDLFLNVKVLYAYRLNSGTKATNTFATAKHSGIRGNDLRIVIEENIDDTNLFDVTLYLENDKIDSQTVASIEELSDNDFVVWNRKASLELTAGIGFTGGANGSITGTSHQTYLDKVEGYVYNIMGVVTTDTVIKQLYINFVKRMREEVGAKFQLVIHNCNADYEAVINIKNNVIDEDYSVASLVYWVVGIQASCEVNKSCLNIKYNGEFNINCDYTQTQLTKAIQDGEFVLHRVNSDICVLSDINSLVRMTEEKGEVFKDNQTIRVIDQIANDIATIFNTQYLGIVPNDTSGRISLKSSIVNHHEQLQNIRAIENFSSDDITVEQGDTKKSVVVVDNITVINTMEKLYMTVKVS